MVNLPIDDIDDEEWSGWENGDCELVNQMVIKSITKKLYSLQNSTTKFLTKTKIDFLTKPITERCYEDISS